MTENRRWYTFICGYYKGTGGNPSKWVAESLKIGVSRRIGLPMSCAFEFGDTVVVLVNTGTKKEPRAVAVAEFRVTGISLSHGILAQILPEFIERGQVKEIGSEPIAVYRECGSYMEGSAYGVSEDGSLPEIMRAAYKYVRENKIEGVSAMLRGLITRVYNPPAVIDGVKFTRGFGHADRPIFDVGSGNVVDSETANGRVAVSIDEYRKRTTKKPSPDQLPLPHAQYDNSYATGSA
jgi:hypothetical protein